MCITGKECLKVRIEGRKLALLSWVPPHSLSVLVRDVYLWKLFGSNWRYLVQLQWARVVVRTSTLIHRQP